MLINQKREHAAKLFLVSKRATKWKSKKMQKKTTTKTLPEN